MHLSPVLCLINLNLQMSEQRFRILNSAGSIVITGYCDIFTQIYFMLIHVLTSINSFI